MSKIKLLAGIILLSFAITLLLYRNSYLENNYFSKLNKTREIKTILYWNTFFRNIKDYYGKEMEPFKLCEIKECYITSNRSYMPIDDFDALIFHTPLYSYKKEKLPNVRKMHQRYIFYNLESSAHFSSDKNVPKRFYNWTMTYWRKSDIYAPYGLVIKQKTDYVVPNVDFVQNKTKLAAWFVSNCGNAKGNRMWYVKELEKYVEIDIYGKCGTKICPRSNSTYCYQMVNDNYLFYLSFENTFCEDYITEKLYKTFSYDVVPIVYGLGNYKELAPPYSVINTADFRTIKDLANYLNYLKEHPDEYLKYFEWKKDYVIISNTDTNVMCTLCKKLHNDNNDVKIYDDIYKWWHSNCMDHNKIEIPKSE